MTETGRSIAVFVVSLFVALPAFSQEANAVPEAVWAAMYERPVTLTLRDGSTVSGALVGNAPDVVTLLGDDGTATVVKKAAVQQLRGQTASSTLAPAAPVESGPGGPVAAPPPLAATPDSPGAATAPPTATALEAEPSRPPVPADEAPAVRVPPPVPDDVQQSREDLRSAVHFGRVMSLGGLGLMGCGSFCLGGGLATVDGGLRLIRAKANHPGYSGLEWDVNGWTMFGVGLGIAGVGAPAFLAGEVVGVIGGVGVGSAAATAANPDVAATEEVSTHLAVATPALLLGSNLVAVGTFLVGAGFMQMLWPGILVLSTSPDSAPYNRAEGLFRQGAMNLVYSAVPVVLGVASVSTGVALSWVPYREEDAE